MAEIRLRARRRIGELTAELQKAPSGKAAHSLSKSEKSKTDALKAAGPSVTEAHRCERIARVPVEDTERKDFTPTEAVEFGRMIEEQHRAKIEAALAPRSLPLPKPVTVPQSPLKISLPNTRTVFDPLYYAIVSYISKLEVLVNSPTTTLHHIQR